MLSRRVKPPAAQACRGAGFPLMFQAGAWNESSASQPERLGRGLTAAAEPRGVSGTERPIKVCFISPLGYGLYRPGSGYPFGGAEAQFFLLSRELSVDESFQASVLTTVKEGPGEERQGALTVVKRQGLDRLGPRAGRTWWDPLGAAPRYAAAFWAMYGILRAIDADVYLHAGAGVEVGAYALICRLLRRRFVFVVVSDADLSKPSTQVRGSLRWLYPIGLRLADGVVCQTREHQNWLRERYGIEGRLIRTGHPTVKRTGEQRTTVLWVGRTHPLKQPQMFLDLVERLPNERCVMVVMRHPEYQDLMTTIQERAGTLVNLTVYEDVPLSDMDQHFERAKLFINTSTYEGFPNTFVQAAVHGTPILSWMVDPDGVLRQHGIGICAAGSFGRLVAAAGQICSSEELRAKLGDRGHEYATTHHDLSRSASELKALVRGLVGQRPRVGE